MSKIFHLRNNNEFRDVYNRGKSFANKHLVMYQMKNGYDYNRIGISVSKKVGNSIVRHRLTRLIREVYRNNLDMFNSGLDIVIIARVGSSECDFYDISRDLIHLAKLHLK